MACKVYEPMTEASAQLEVSATDLEPFAGDAGGPGAARLPVRRVLLGCAVAAGMVACVPVLANGRGVALNRPSREGRFISELRTDPAVEERTVWIKSDEHQKMCLSVAGGENKNAVPAQIDFCDSEDTSMQLMVPKSGHGLIKWSKHPEKCLHSSDGELMWWDCDKKKEDQQVFKLSGESSGTIQLASTSECLAVPTGGGDTTGFLEVGDCKPVNAQFILEDVPGICTYSEWSKWSECTDKCGGGVSARSRAVIAHQESDDGSECDGRFETRRCNAQRCPAAA